MREMWQDCGMSAAADEKHAMFVEMKMKQVEVNVRLQQLKASETAIRDLWLRRRKEKGNPEPNVLMQVGREIADRTGWHMTIEKEILLRAADLDDLGKRLESEDNAAGKKLHKPD